MDPDERRKIYSELLSKPEEEPKGLQKFGALISLGAAVISVVLAVLALFISPNQILKPHPDNSYKPAQNDISTNDLAISEETRRKLSLLEIKQADLERKIADIRAAQSLPTANERPGEFERRLNAVELGLGEVKKNSETLSVLLGDDPAKKMAVVILSRDLADLKESTAKEFSSQQTRDREDIAVLREENKSQIEFIKWAVVFAGASNLIGPLLSFFRRKKSNDSEDAEGDTAEE